MADIEIPSDLRYSREDEWVRREEGRAVVGITDYAQDQLGDIVFVELPQVGDVFAHKAVFATVESVKAVSECYLPVGGEIVGVNQTLEDKPELVNASPYGDGWFVEVKPDDLSQMDALMTSVQCREKLKGAP